LCFVSLAAEVTKNKGKPLWHDKKRHAIKARPIVTNRLGSGGTHSFEKKYVRFFFNLFFKHFLNFRFTFWFDCNYVVPLLQIDIYGQDPFVMELKKACDIGTKAFFATFDGLTLSARVKDNNVIGSTTKSDV
jgi:hypothetical protein